MTNEDVFIFMQNNYISKICVHFSGGGDEGHVEGIDFYGLDDKEIDYKFPPAHKSYGWCKDENDNEIESEYVVTCGEREKDRGDGEMFKVRIYREATDYETRMGKLHDAIEQPIYDRYGSFAGEFSVYGTLVWEYNAEKKQGEVRLSGDESAYEHFEEVI